MYNRYIVNKLHKLMQVRFAGFYGNYVLLLIEHNISTCNKKNHHRLPHFICYPGQRTTFIWSSLYRITG